MANGHGGKRVGAGRRPKPAAERALAGRASHNGPPKVVQHPSAPPPAVEPKTVDEADAPNCLTVDERLVWLRLAPLAMAKGTLTDDEALAFEVMCKNIVLERQYALSRIDAGGPNHRGMIKIIDTELARFGLHGQGKPVVAASVETFDPLEAKYFGSGRHSA